jgi:DNA-directed RNA polymerase sigma subunit (sigma70/sigma32)
MGSQKMADELNVNKETIRQILREDLPKVRPIQTHIMPRVHPDLSRQSQFS